MRKSLGVSILVGVLAMLSPTRDGHAAGALDRDGLFVLGTCDAPEYFVVNADSLQLYGDDTNAEFTATEIGPVDAQSGFARATAGDISYFVAPGPEGGLTYLYVKEGAKNADTLVPPKLAEIDDQVWDREDVVRCDRLATEWAMLHGEAVSVLMRLSAVRTACEATPASCADAFFAVADIAGDGVLRGAEIARMLRVLAYLASASGDDAKNEDIAATQAVMIAAAPVIASALLGSLDYNGDGGLSLAEIGTDRFDTSMLPTTLGAAGPKEMRKALDSISRSLKDVMPLLDMAGGLKKQ